MKLRSQANVELEEEVGSGKNDRGDYDTILDSEVEVEVEDRVGLNSNMNQKERDNDYEYKITLLKLEMEEKERERVFEIEKLRMQLGHQLDMQQCTNLSRGYRIESTEINFPKMGPTEDIDSFIRTFEKLCIINDIPKDKWANKLAPLLVGKARTIYANLSIDDCRSYDRIKTTLLERYMLTPETYRKKFRASERRTESYTEWVADLSDLAKRWLEGKGALGSPEKILEVVILEQMLEKMPTDLRLWLMDKSPQSAEEAAQLADHYLGSRRDFQADEAMQGSQTSLNKSRVRSYNRSQNQDSFQTSRQQNQPIHVGNQVRAGQAIERKREVQCFNCSDWGHFASECPRRDWQVGRIDNFNQVGNPPNFQNDGRRYQNQNERPENGPVCYGCGNRGHIRKNCPQAQMTLNRTGSSYQNESSLKPNQERDTLFCKTTTEQENFVRRFAKYTSKGYVGDRAYDMLRDTGSSITLVRPEVVDPKDKLAEKVTISCLVGSQEISTARVLLRNTDHKINAEVKVGILEALPIPVLLGNDLFCIDEEEEIPTLDIDQSMVVTRARAKEEMNEVDTSEGSDVKVRSIVEVHEPNEVVVKVDTQNISDNKVVGTKLTLLLCQHLLLLLLCYFVTTFVTLLVDIVIHSETREDHLGHTSEVLERLKSANLTVKPSKCKFAKAKVIYLGHVIGGGEVSPDPFKLEAVSAFPKPVTKKDVRAFLGLAGYYRRFIPSFSEITAPLSDLTKKNLPEIVKWDESCNKAFQTAKEALTNKPVLRNPDYSREFILQIDASSRGIGAVLSQDFDDGEHPIVYMSRKLLPREMHYPIIEKECLALLWGVTQFKPYIFGRTIKVQTDHNPLRWLDQMNNKNARLTRWSLSLQSQAMSIEHKPGIKNGNADGLSRA